MAAEESEMALMGQGQVHALRSSSVDYASSDEEILSQTRFSQSRRRVNGSRSKGDYFALDPREQQTSRTRRACGWCFVSRKCCVVTFIFVVVVLLLTGGGGFWIYRKSPADGQSPPWYPSPLGGMQKTWQESYEKARAMVTEMTLPEKVNVTTGIGVRITLVVSF